MLKIALSLGFGRNEYTDYGQTPSLWLERPFCIEPNKIRIGMGDTCRPRSQQSKSEFLGPGGEKLKKHVLILQYTVVPSGNLT